MPSLSESAPRTRVVVPSGLRKALAVGPRPLHHGCGPHDHQPPTSPDPTRLPRRPTLPRGCPTIPFPSKPSFHRARHAPRPSPPAHPLHNSPHWIPNSPLPVHKCVVEGSICSREKSCTLPTSSSSSLPWVLRRHKYAPKACVFIPAFHCAVPPPKGSHRWLG